MWPFIEWNKCQAVTANEEINLLLLRFIATQELQPRGNISKGDFHMLRMDFYGVGISLYSPLLACVLPPKKILQVVIVKYSPVIAIVIFCCLFAVNMIWCWWLCSYLFVAPATRAASRQSNNQSNYHEVLNFC